MPNPMRDEERRIQRPALCRGEPGPEGLDGNFERLAQHPALLVRDLIESIDHGRISLDVELCIAPRPVASGLAPGALLLNFAASEFRPLRDGADLFRGRGGLGLLGRKARYIEVGA